MYSDKSPLNKGVSGPLYKAPKQKCCLHFQNDIITCAPTGPDPKLFHGEFWHQSQPKELLHLSALGPLQQVMCSLFENGIQK